MLPDMHDPSKMAWVKFGGDAVSLSPLRPALWANRLRFDKARDKARDKEGGKA
jgi:hypothetical protein